MLLFSRGAAMLMMLVMAQAALAYDSATAMNNFASEYTECAVYYGIAAEGFRRMDKPKDTDRAEQASRQAYLIASMFSEPEAVAARTELYTKEQASQMQFDYAAISVLILKYNDICKSAIENPRGRLSYWLSKT